MVRPLYDFQDNAANPIDVVYFIQNIQPYEYMRQFRNQLDYWGPTSVRGAGLTASTQRTE
jgi:hypothetical protein